MNNNCLLSICIPTYKRAQLLRNTLNSIYAQNVDHKLFEVCISDDSPDDDTKNMIEEEFSSIGNLVYQKVPDHGYNIVEALKLGKGSFLKCQNDYAIFKEGSLQKLINLVSSNLERKPILYFGLKSVKSDSKNQEFNNFNDFIYCVDLMSTFLSSIGLWKEDFNICNSNNIELVQAFPHTSYLYNCTFKTSIIVDNYDYFVNQDSKTKGGYNLPQFFVQEFLNLVDKTLFSKSLITQNTREKLENNIIQFVANWYLTTKIEHNKYKFKFDNCEKIIRDKCGQQGLDLFLKNTSSFFFIKRLIRYYLSSFKKLIISHKLMKLRIIK